MERQQRTTPEVPDQHPGASLPAEVSLAEFAALRSEVIQRISSQATLAAGGVAGIGALFLLRGDFVVWVPTVSFLLSTLYQANTYWIHQVAKYIREELWPRLISDVAPAVWWRVSWEHYMFTDPPRLTVHGTLSFVAEGAAPALFAAASIFSMASTPQPGPWLPLNITLTLLIVLVAIVFQTSSRIPRSRQNVLGENGESPVATRK